MRPPSFASAVLMASRLAPWLTSTAAASTFSQGWRSPFFEQRRCYRSNLTWKSKPYKIKKKHYLRKFKQAATNKVVPQFDNIIMGIQAKKMRWTRNHARSPRISVFKKLS